MRWLLFGCFLLLCSCSGASLTNKITESAVISVESLESTLPSECKSDGIKASINSIKTQINAISTACDTEKELLQEKISTLKAIILALVGILLLALRKIFF